MIKCLLYLTILGEICRYIDHKRSFLRCFMALNALRSATEGEGEAEPIVEASKVEEKPSEASTWSSLSAFAEALEAALQEMEQREPQNGCAWPSEESPVAFECYSIDSKGYSIPYENIKFKRGSSDRSLDFLHFREDLSPVLCAYLQ